MDNNPTDLFAQRVFKLEQQNRTLRRVVAAVLVGGFLLTIVGSKPPDKVPKVVEAEQFVVRDAKGKDRIRIGTEENGSMASIVLLNDEGIQTAKLFVNDLNKSSALTLTTSQETSSTVLYMKEDGSSHLSVQKEKKVRCSVGMGGKDSGPSIYILDANGNVQFRAPQQ